MKQDSIDRIAPIAAINPTATLRVAESNKDGRQKPGDNQQPRESRNDVLELHSGGVSSSWLRSKKRTSHPRLASILRFRQILGTNPSYTRFNLWGQRLLS